MNQLFGDIMQHYVAKFFKLGSAKMCRLALFKSSFPNDIKYL